MQSDNSQPLISVIMPVYNCERYVGQAIESIINQTYPNWELLICDDGSSDRSWEIIQMYGVTDRRILMFRNYQNCGKVFAVNRMYELCKGTYITIHDADDWSELNRFKILLDFFGKNAQYVLLGSSYRNVDSNGEIISNSYMHDDYIHILNNIGIENKIHGPTIMFMKNIVHQIGGLFRGIKMGEDIDFIWRVGERFPITNNTDTLYNYRINPNSMTKCFKHDLLSKVIDRNLILKLAKQRKETGTDCILENDQAELDKLKNDIRHEYKVNELKYIDEYASYLLFYKFKCNSILFIIYNIFTSGFNLQKLKLLLYIILYR